MSYIKSLSGADAATYKQLQSQLNRVGQSVTVDGQLGPKTLAALQAVLRFYPASVKTPASVNDIIGSVDDYVTFLSTLPGVGAKAPSAPGPRPTAPPPPAPSPGGGFLSGGMGGLFSNPLVIAGGVFAVLLFTVGRRKKS
jgi:peptidoglycan hydrolase-like protein with peptidoglycan-binding domain